MRKKEYDLTGKYKKNPDEENFLLKLNDILSEYQEREYADLLEKYPTLFIVGIPRSGTTLLHQVIVSAFDIGYIDNLIASFWKAPLYGVKLSKKLFKDEDFSSSYRSRFGRTDSLREPHEFGYFWNLNLSYEDMLEKDGSHEDCVDWIRLKKILTNMTYAFKKPLIMKSFLMIWHIRRMAELLEKSCFLWVKRDPVKSAISLLNMRQEYVGAKDRWVSILPREFEWLKNESYHKQVAGQVYYLERAVKEGLEGVHSSRKLIVNYEDFVTDPEHFILKIDKMVKENGFKIGRTQHVIPFFEETRKLDMKEPDIVKVKREIERFYAVNS